MIILIFFFLFLYVVSMILIWVLFSKKISSLSFLRQIKKEINELIVELDESMERNMIILDDRLTELKHYKGLLDKSIEEAKNFVNQEVKSNSETSSVNLHKQIFSLREQGFTRQEISQKLQISQREIELILHLH